MNMFPGIMIVNYIAESKTGVTRDNNVHVHAIPAYI